MPVLNEERHLGAAVRRVLDQDYPGELEVILRSGLATTERARSPTRLRRSTRGSEWWTIRLRVRLGL